MRVEVERLIKQAERDLVNARKSLAAEAYELAAFVCHQAVEKYLKAAWGLGVAADLRSHFAYLNPDYTTARYPDAANGVPYEVYDRATAEAKIRTVEKVFPWLRQLTQTKK